MPESKEFDTDVVLAFLSGNDRATKVHFNAIASLLSFMLAKPSRFTVDEMLQCRGRIVELYPGLEPGVRKLERGRYDGAGQQDVYAAWVNDQKRVLHGRSRIPIEKIR